LRVLTNPRYAGTYAYGRRRYRRAADGKEDIRKRESGEWLACIPNAHPGYITWQQYQQNLELLTANGRTYALVRSSPPREGAALLQGRAVCGRCGRHFRVTYRSGRGKQEAWYVCDRAHGALGEPNCQSIAAPPVDAAVGVLVAERMTPAAVELHFEEFHPRIFAQPLLPREEIGSAKAPLAAEHRGGLPATFVLGNQFSPLRPRLPGALGHVATMQCDANLYKMGFA
jgi:Recombinase zinc beta ribbon domain/Recombinase